MRLDGLDLDGTEAVRKRDGSQSCLEGALKQDRDDPRRLPKAEDTENKLN